MPFAPTLTDNADLPEVRTKLQEAGQYLVGLQRVTADKRDETWSADVRSAVDFVNHFDRIEVALQAGERAANAAAMAAAAERAERMGRSGPRAAGMDLSEGEPQSTGDEVLASDAYQTWAEGGRSGALAIETRTLLYSGASGGVGLLRPVGQPYLPGQTIRRQRLFVRDLLSVQATGLSTVPYLQELNPITNETGAGMVAEGSAKPEVVMEFSQAEAPIRKIAAWIPASDEILADAPTLRGYIDTRLAYMIKLKEESQVLNGNGTTPNIKGIRQQTGLQTQAIVAGDFPATIGLAIGKIENVDGDADGVACNPLDFWVAQTTRHANDFDGEGMGNAPAGVSNQTWGLPVVRTRSMESGKALVGSWALGATLFDREGLTIVLADQHSDWFIYNKVAIRGEERVGLAVFRPDFFVEATVPTS